MAEKDGESGSRATSNVDAMNVAEIPANSQPAAEEEAKEAPPKPAGPPMPPGPVDHGLLCWLQVIGSFAMWTNSWGIINSFGVFQTYYEVIQLSGKSPSQISWIGGLQAFFLVTGGTLSGPLFDAGYFHAMNLAGNSFVVFGLMMTSICDEYWQTILAQGCVVGIGCGLLFIPATGILPQYFVKRRALVGSLAAAGSGFGGLIYPIIFRELQGKIGFGWAVRVIAFVALALGIIANITARNKKPPGKMRKLIDPAAFRHAPLMAFAIGGIFAFMGLYVPAYYIGIYSLEEGISGETMAFYLVAIMQAGSIIGRLGPSFIADKLGPINLVIPALLGCGILGLCWIAIKNTAGLIVFAILYGSFFGLALGMMPAGVASLLKGDMRIYGTYLGTAMLIASPGVLVGSPICGAILRSGAGFVGLQAFSACMLLLAAILMGVSRVLAVGWGLHKV